MNQKTLIQFAHLGKKFAYYIRLVAGGKLWPQLQFGLFALLLRSPR